MKSRFFFFIFFFFTNFSLLYGESKIVFINLDEIVNNSIAGKKLIKKTNKMENDFLTKSSEIEKKLKVEENDIISKKNIMDKEQYNQQVVAFKKKIETYKKNKLNKIEELRNFKIKQTNIFLNQIAPILKTYSTDNSISMILQKKDILIGKSDFDITDIIIKKVNKLITNVEDKQ